MYSNLERQEGKPVARIASVGAEGLRRKGQLRFSESFPLALGASLTEGVVDFELTGPPAGPVVVVLGGISADRRVSDWWSDIVGPARAIDVKRFRVLGIDWLRSGIEAGSLDGWSESTPYPLITTQDQARALIAVLDELGIQEAHALVGASYGGMVGLAAAADYPSRIERLVTISGAHRTHPMATAHRMLQRSILALAQACGRGRDGLVLARALAMTTYRTTAEFEARFTVDPIAGPAGRFEVEEYLLARGKAFAEKFSPGVFAGLSHSIDLHRVDPARVAVPVDLISVDSDELVPAWLMDELAELLPGERRHHRIGSRWGHDAFLKEPHVVGQLVSEALDEGRSGVFPSASNRRVHHTEENNHE